MAGTGVLSSFVTADDLRQIVEIASGRSPCTALVLHDADMVTVVASGAGRQMAVTHRLGSAMLAVAGSGALVAAFVLAAEGLLASWHPSPTAFAAAS